MFSNESQDCDIIIIGISDTEAIQNAIKGTNLQVASCLYLIFTINMRSSHMIITVATIDKQNPSFGIDCLLHQKYFYPTP